MRPTITSAACTATALAAALAIGYGAGSIAKGEEKKEASPATGTEVERMKQLEGTWDAKMIIKAPGAPDVESKGVQTAKLGCGGMWLITDYKGELMGMPYEGHGVQGYNVEKKKYVQIWVDAMSSSIDVNEGTYDAAAKTFHFKGKGKDPESGKSMDYTMKTVIESRDRNVFTMEMALPDGKTESLRIEYTRRK